MSDFNFCPNGRLRIGKIKKQAGMFLFRAFQ